MKKKIAVVLAILILPVAGLVAQESGSYSILSFDIGYAPLYDFGASGSDPAYQTPAAFGLNIRITDQLSAGFFTYQTGSSGSGGTSLLKIKYDIIPQARASLSFGYDSAASGSEVIGLGVEGIPFQRKTGSLATDFKLGIDYLWTPSADIGDGKLVFTLAVGVGI
jgi:hypothetical protein